MSSAREDAEFRFPADVAAHRMTVIRDDGLYRHLRFAEPGTRCGSFDILTWPGYLCFCGDMGDYLFMRLEDMFDLFRGDRINPSYWAEKVQAEDKDSGIREYSEPTARAWVKQQLEDYDADDQALAECADLDYESERSIRDGIERIDFDGFSDSWEADFTDYTYRYVWCCCALVWAIRQYDAHRAGQEVAK